MNGKLCVFVATLVLCELGQKAWLAYAHVSDDDVLEDVVERVLLGAHSYFRFPVFFLICEWWFKNIVLVTEYSIVFYLNYFLI